MAKEKNTKNIQVENTVLNQFNADVEALHLAHNTQKEEALNKVLEAKKEYDKNMAEAKEQLDKMESGEIDFDFFKYNSNLHLLPKIKKDIDDVEKSLEEYFISLDRTYNTGKDQIKNAQVEKLQAEYNANRLKILKAIFEHMMESVKLSQQLTKLGVTYGEAVANLGLQGRVYVDFTPRLGKLVDRFLLNASAIKYSRHLTNSQYDFEEDYFLANPIND